MPGFDRHPDWNTLAALAERGSTGADCEVLAHLGSCPECMAAFSAAVESRHRELDEAEIRPAAALGGGARRESRRRLGTTVLGLGSLAAAAMLLWMVFPRASFHDETGMATTILQQQLDAMSAVGMVYPRAEWSGYDDSAVYRSGALQTGEADLTVWVARLARDPADTTAAFWLAVGHLGQGRPDDAADVVRRALRLSPRARELRHLAAIAAYRRNDLASASESLDALLRSSPRDDLAALNRALIEVEAGERDGGCGVLNELAAAAADPMVRQRARELVTQFACP